METSNVMEDVRAACRVSTPIIGIKTYNPQELVKRLTAEMNGDSPVVHWDHVRGLRGLNEKGKAALGGFDGDMLMSSRNPVVALEMCAELPPKTRVLIFNAHNYVRDVAVATGIGNLRDPYKATNRTLILLAPTYDLPPELRTDVVLLKDQLPADPELRAIAEDVFKTAKLQPDESKFASMVDAGRGLPSFTFEQQAYMSLRKQSDGGMMMNMDALWERKVETVNATPGLKMTMQPFDRDSIKGQDAILDYMEALGRGAYGPRVIGFVDEIDKAFAGFGGGGGGGDTSGVTADQVMVFLKTMENREWTGSLLYGPAGTGKTMVASGVAGILGIPCVHLDLGAMKSRYVGDSEDRIRYAVDALDRIGNGRVYIMATCNRIQSQSMPPELRRRFTAGTWFFDLLDESAREACFTYYAAKFGVKVKASHVATATGWTGAEIRNACRTARDCDITLGAAMEYIVPVCMSSAKEIQELRMAADGRFLDASHGGKYSINRSASSTSGRKLEA